MKYQEMFSFDDNDSRGIILNMLKPNSKVLEFGCATGNMTKYMSEEMMCEVYIVELDREGFDHAINYAVEGICGDILSYEWLKKFNIKFDFVIFADVLEHLPNPQEVLEKVNQVLAYNGSVLISVPNIAHNDILIKLYKNQFEYTPTGLLDATHIHFFTDLSLEQCCMNAGYQIIQRKNTVINTGKTEQNAEINSHMMKNLLSIREGGEIYQNIVELKTKKYCADNKIKKLLNVSNNIYRYLTVYFNTGDGYSEENTKIITATKTLNDCFVCQATIDLPNQIKELRIDPIEGESCLIIKSQFASQIKEFNYIICDGIQKNEMLLLLGSDPQLIIPNLENTEKINIYILFTIEGTDSYLEGIKELSMNATKDITDTAKEITNTVKEITNTTKNIEDTAKDIVDTTNKIVDTTNNSNHKLNEVLNDMNQITENISLSQSELKEKIENTLDNMALIAESQKVNQDIVNKRFSESYESIKYIQNMVSRTLDTEKMYHNYENLIMRNHELEGIVVDERSKRESSEKEMNSLKNEISSLELQIAEITKQTAAMSDEYIIRLQERSEAVSYWENLVNHMRNTRSWKITAPLRIPGHIRKRLCNKGAENVSVENTLEQEYDIKFSILMPVYNVDIKWLEKAIESIKKQTYTNWELCIVDDASTDKKVSRYLKGVKSDNIKIHFQKRNKGISLTTNAAAKMAVGQYILLMDNDDEISRDALMEFWKCIKETDADVVYSDQDIIDQNEQHSCPVFKPNWSPDLLRSQMYLGHMVGFRKEIFDNVGGFRKGFDGSQDYDLLLRITEQTQKIEHISKILYSWRALPSSTAANPDSKPYAQYAGLNAVQEHLDRTLGKGIANANETENLYVYDVTYKLQHDVLISIIIPTKDHAKDLKTAIDSIVSKSSYHNYEIIILNNNSQEKETYQYFEKLKQQYDNVVIEDAMYEFNWSKLNNHGIGIAKGDVYLFLNNDIMILSSDWLERLASQALRPGVGAVGGMLLYEDGTIQHGGVIIGLGGWADHAYKGAHPAHNGTPFISPVLTRNVTAVTGACMAISRRTIELIGLFDDNFIICGSDVEICIRAINNGLVNIYDPHIRLIHYESKSRGNDVPQIDFDLSYNLYAPYRENGDPYYNNNLDYTSLIPKIRGEQPSDTEIIPVQFTDASPQVHQENVNELLTKNDAPEVNEDFMEVTVGEIRPIHFRKVQLSKKRLNILLPTLNPEQVFGGIATAYKFFQEMQNKLTGCTYRIILVDCEPNSSAFEIYGNEYIFADSQDDTEYNKMIVPFYNRAKRTLAVSDKDYFVLTGWWTAYCIQEEYYNWETRGLTPNPLIYLIQDYEPGFYKWSSMYLFADATYRTRFEQIAVFNSSELKCYFDFLGYQFDHHYVFEPILNAGLKKYLKNLPKTVKKSKQILVYGRPNTERNAFELLVQALRKWVSIQTDVSKWRILSAGEAHKNVDLGKGVVLQSLGKLTIEEYAKTLEESYAGVSLMVSPHPSYPPLEMSVFGVKVITNSYANKDLSKFNNNIVSLTDASPIGIATALKTICNNYKSEAIIDLTANEEYCNGDNDFPFIDELITVIRGNNINIF